MKIVSLELFTVPPRWLFLKITTDSGIEGWGEPIVEGKAATVAMAVREMECQLLGRDPGAIEDIWQALYRGGFYRGGPVLTSALSGIDQALWDIKGKALGVPVHELLGGPVRERMRVYSWIGGETPADVGRMARERREQGYTAVKMGATSQCAWIDSGKVVDAVCARLQAIRDAVGLDLDVAVDFHGRIHKGMARVMMREMEPYRLFFVEEPVLCENEEAFRELRRAASMPIATGERNYTRWGFKGLISGGGVDIVQPDLSHAGGISEVRRIAAMAEAYDVALAPHCPLGPIALASSLQVDFCTPNALIQEQSLGIHYHKEGDAWEYLADPGVFAYRDGMVDRPTAPGLGIAINEETVRRAAEKGHAWHNPVWRLPDGTVTEW
ncbi:MAG: galactonate dehydratase [Lentisphaeria bacterium]|nr:galactonate dehydratase [Lentisphaeria bacterium]